MRRRSRFMSDTQHRLTMSGHDFVEGDKLVMLYGAANRDLRVFEDPETFGVTRSPNPHLGFGGPDPHFCLGANLARRELPVVFRQLLTRLPDIEVAGDAVPLEFGGIPLVTNVGRARWPVAMRPPATGFSRRSGKASTDRPRCVSAERRRSVAGRPARTRDTRRRTPGSRGRRARRTRRHTARASQRMRRRASATPRHAAPGGRASIFAGSCRFRRSRGTAGWRWPLRSHRDRGRSRRMPSRRVRTPSPPKASRLSSARSNVSLSGSSARMSARAMSGSFQMVGNVFETYPVEAAGNRPVSRRRALRRRRRSSRCGSGRRASGRCARRCAPRSSRAAPG